MITVEITPRSRQVLLNIQEQVPLTQEGLRAALHDVGAMVVKETRRLIKTGPKTGRLYKISGRLHRASSRGEAPANRTGKLQKSANYRVQRFDKMAVGMSAEYAAFLELGTRKIAPRPHLIAAINNKAGDTIELIEARIAETVNA